MGRKFLNKHVPARTRRKVSMYSSWVVGGCLLVAIEVSQIYDLGNGSDMTALMFPFVDRSGNDDNSMQSTTYGQVPADGRQLQVVLNASEEIADERQLQGGVTTTTTTEEADSLGSYPEDLIIKKPYNSAKNKVLVLIHLILACYAFLGLNTVCDIYFTGALEVMVDTWKIKADVAGATFMAAGGSAPELFTSLIGAVITTNDVGFGTIVGSAVFNVLFVIGACGFAAKKAIKLTWWPLFRDCTYYVISLGVLAVLSSTGDGLDADGKSKDKDKDIAWWEALVLFLMYVIYCVIMYFNESLEAMTDVEFMRAKKAGQESGQQPAPRLNQVAPEPLDLRDAAAPENSPGPPGPPEHHRGKDGAPVDEEAPSQQTAHHGGHHHAGKIEAALFLSTAAADRHDERMKSLSPRPQNPEENPEKNPEADQSEDKQEQEEGDDDEDDELLKMPDPREEPIAFIQWILSLPVYVPLYYGIPEPSEKCFIVTFLLSLVWIAGFSFFLVWWISLFGECYGIPITIMSFTALAAGTSIPDMVSSVAVARNGYGDMAVSSSIGSNIFDILVGLPVPWMIKIGIVEGIANGKKDYRVGMESPFLAFYVLILLFMVFMVVLSIHLLGWVLNQALGAAMGGLYILFLVVVLSVELTYEYTDEKLEWLQMS